MDFVKEIETKELIEKLRQRYPGFVEAFLAHENKVYTKKGRLNKSGACRVLDAKPKQLDDIIADCQKMLEDDLLPD